MEKLLEFFQPVFTPGIKVKITFEGEYNNKTGTIIEWPLIRLMKELHYEYLIELDHTKEKVYIWEKSLEKIG